MDLGDYSARLVRKSYLNISANHKPVLIFDQYKVHISKFLQGKKICYDVIPAGTTGYLQPLDVSINRPLKVYIKNKFDKWYTTFGSSQANTTPKDTEDLHRMIT